MLLYKSLGNVVGRGGELVVLFTGGCCNAYLYGCGLTGRCSVTCRLGYGCPECVAYMYNRCKDYIFTYIFGFRYLCAFVHMSTNIFWYTTAYVTMFYAYWSLWRLRYEGLGSRKCYCRPAGCAFRFVFLCLRSRFAFQTVFRLPKFKAV